MEFRLLGPLEVADGDHTAALGGPRQQAVLAALAMRANETVGLEYLTDAAWQTRPASLRANLRTYIANLRRILVNEDGARVVTTTGGYRLVVHPGERDVDAFESFVERAARANRHGAVAEAVDLYDRALSLWRGRPPLAGLTLGPGLEAAVARLDERWFQAAEGRMESRLRGGAPEDTIGELRALAAEYPLRESLAELLMRALYSAGRSAEALETFQRSFRAVVDRLGIEPGPRLHSLQHSILKGEPLPATAGPPTNLAGSSALLTQPPNGSTLGPVPFNLPAGANGFTGRRAELSRLDRLADRTGTEPVLAAVTGMGGVGKTALVLRWAHAVAGRFPDGQLYLDLRGYGAGQPVSTEEAQERILRKLGVPPERIPSGDEERRDAYRSALLGRQMLLVLDNARTAAQIRPLLPGAAGCLVLVTSRDGFVGLVAMDGAYPIALDVLSPDESLRLLTDLVGDDRARAEPAALAELARLCAYLPLALRLAAARLVIRPHHSVQALVQRLGRDALDVLQAPHDRSAAVRTAFDHSYLLLDEPARLLFRRLALAPGTDLSTPVAAALLNAPATATERLLDGLTCAHLVDEYRTGRYRQHDLLRHYAAELAAVEDSEDDRSAAVLRTTHWYLAAATQATGILDPHRRRGLPLPLVSPDRPPLVVATHEEALAWCEAERSNLVAAVGQAAAYGLYDLAWQLAMALFGFFELRKYWLDWLETHATGLAAARRIGARPAEAWLLNSLGIAEKQLGRFESAIERYRAALAIRHEIGDRHGAAATLNNLGTVANRAGRAGEAIEHYQEALAAFRETGDRWGEGLTLTNLGEAYRGQSAFEPARTCFTEALEIRRSLGDQRGEGILLNNLANTAQGQGRASEAIQSYRQAIRLRLSAGDRWGVARTLTNLGLVLEKAGRPVPARRCWRWALDIFEDLGDGQRDQVRALLDGEPIRRSTIPSNRSAST